jgi:hypothetical protein
MSLSPGLPGGPPVHGLPARADARLRFPRIPAKAV